MASFWAEIKRRKVFQAVVLYAVTAWLLVQVITAVEAPLSLPDWVDTFVIVLLAIGFPIVLILAWVFDFAAKDKARMASSGFKEEQHRPAPVTFTYVIQGLVLLAVGFLILDQYWLDDAERAPGNTAATGGAVPAGAAQAMRLTVPLPEGIRFAVGEDFWHSASISPDGQAIAFSGVELASGTARMYVRPIDSVEAVPIAGSEDGTSLFWSPDSESVGFVANGRLQVVSLAGGPPRRLADSRSIGGAAWGPGDRILASLRSPGPIELIRLDGGDPVAVTELDASAQERDHVWPQWMDDGEHFFYTATGITAAQSRVFVSSLNDPAPKPLLEGVGAFWYMSPDVLLYIQGGVLFRQRFDPDRLEPVGRPVAIAAGASTPLSASDTGAVTYRTVAAAPLGMTWIRTDGTEIGPALPPGYYVDPSISPDGTQLAFAAVEDETDNWSISILDLASGNIRRLTLDESTNRAPIWSPDGERIAFLSLRQASPGIYLRRANGVGDEEFVLPSPGSAWPYWWSEQNEIHFFSGVFGNNELWAFSPDGAGEPTPLVRTVFNEVDGVTSPDGEWYVYSQNESGRFEIYLTTYPPSSTKLLVTPRGGADPFWSPDGTELYYVRPSTSELMAVAVEPGNPPQFGEHRRIHPGLFFYPDNHPFFLTPDGERILIAPSSQPAGDITILLNWQARAE